MMRILFNGFSFLLLFIVAICVLAMVLNDRQANFDNFIYYLLIALIMLFIIVVQVVLASVQAYESLKSTKYLEGMASSSVTVLRDGGQRQTILSTELVVGDVVLLRTNVKVPADLRLVELKSMKLDRSNLTGESEPITCTLSSFHEAKVKHIHV